MVAPTAVARALLWAACLQSSPRATLAVMFKQAGGNDPYPHFDINLDLPPRQRWKHLVPQYREWFISITQRRKDFLKPYNSDQLKEFLANQQIDQEYIEEIKGIVEEVNHTEATLEMSLLGHMKYELGMTQYTECTGILATMENGTVVQGRNMDLDPKMAWGKKGILRATFWKGGNAIFTSVGAFGIVAVGDGMRFGAWSAQQNTRRTEQRTTRERWMSQTIDAAKKGSKLFGFELRRLLTEEASFTRVVNELSTMKSTAPLYAILAGAQPYEGVVISMDRYSGHHAPGHDVLKLSSTKTGLQSPKRYLVQTNDDHWKQPADDRRTAAKMSMSTTSSSRMGVESMFAAMRKPPVCNVGTWYTWVSIPALNVFEITNDPCAQR